MKQFSKFVGMEVHKATIAVSVADANGGEVRYVGKASNTPEAIEKVVRQLRKSDAHLSFCYEAGPCEYGIHRPSAIGHRQNRLSPVQCLNLALLVHTPHHGISRRIEIQTDDVTRLDNELRIGP